MSGNFEKIADICVDEEDNVIVNFPLGISLDRMFKIMDKAILSLVQLREGRSG